jgi:SPP1 gp7 family putative phage head morphogenesis protein
MTTYQEMRNRKLKHIEDAMRDDQKVKRSMSRIYNRSLEDIQRHIDADIQKFAYKENVSMAEAKKLISKTDVESFQDKAKQYVEEKNFTPKANRELRRYNVTMRTNRLELLQARINLEMIAQSLDEERLTEQHITDEAVKEFERQAGILNISVPSQNQINALAKSIALADVSGVTFSDRVWANQNELRERVNTAIERALIRGEHPRETARSIRRLVRDEHGKSKRAADRIAITETARAQSLMARESFIQADVDSYIWIAEPSACPECAALDDKVLKVKDFNVYPPAHPHCRCAIAGYVDDIEESSTPS